MISKRVRDALIFWFIAVGCSVLLLMYGSNEPWSGIAWLVGALVGIGICGWHYYQTGGKRLEPRAPVDNEEENRNMRWVMLFVISATLVSRTFLTQEHINYIGEGCAMAGIVFFGYGAVRVTLNR